MSVYLLPDVYYLFYFVLQYEFFFLNGCLQRRNLQIIAKLDRNNIYSTLPLLPAHEHSNIYMQFCMWDDYHVFLITTLVFTRLVLDDIYLLLELPFDWLMMQCLFVSLMMSFWVSCYSKPTRETGGFELASTITLVVQANRLTKCASQVFYRCFRLLEDFS